ncbi:MAG TPA: hypothetical protein VFE24_06400, partial [Pirellulales bacterium]|nr:hypothetical protein [Pirellulales bacterium]
MTQTMFFALTDDLLALLEIVESKGSLKYTLMGNFLADEMTDGPTVYSSGAAIRNLGKAKVPSATGCNRFLVCESGMSINLESFNGKTSKRVLIDQLINPDTVTFAPGGAWDDDVILSGRVATVSTTPIAQALMRRFKNAIKKTFTKVRAYYVGPQALVQLQNGKRLTAAVQCPLSTISRWRHNKTPRPPTTRGFSRSSPVPSVPSLRHSRAGGNPARR